MSRQSKVFAIRQLAQILLASESGCAAPQIARVLESDENQVRRGIREFNADANGVAPPSYRGRASEEDR